MILVSPFIYFIKGGFWGIYTSLYIPFFVFLLFNTNNRFNKVLFVLFSISSILLVTVGFKNPQLWSHIMLKKFQFLYFSIHIIFEILLTCLIVVFIKQKLYYLEQRSYSIIKIAKENFHTKTSVQDKDIAMLSRREREVYYLIFKGKTNKEIADSLFVSTGTVKNHITSIYKKLNVTNRAEFLNKIC